MISNNTPTIFIILGGTGDLMRRKILPALFNLYKSKLLPTKFKVIGVARSELDDNSYRKYIVNILKDRKVKISEKSSFVKNFHYCRADLRNLKEYQCITGEVSAIDQEWRVCSNKLFYLAIFPELYKITLQNLAKSGLTKPCGPTEGWTRVLIEKPFGKNLKQTQALDALLGKLFKEVQIYRIDHYLGKDMVRNIINFRFSNNLFEGIWNNKYIEKIDIRLWETIGVEERGEFYDGLGALRDVGQNHLLQVLALTCMENPASFDPEAIRTKRAELLEKLCCLNKKEIINSTFRAQYEGYRKIKGVNPNSTTETYFKIKTYINSPRWQGVPIFLESGKRLKEARKEVVVTLKHPIPCLLCPPGISEHYKNQIQISWEPKEEIKVFFWSKKPGKTYQLERKYMGFSLREIKKRTQYVQEYEQLLLDAISGDQTSFVSTREVSAMWSFVDPIVVAWQKNLVPLHYYRPNTLDIIKVAQKALEPKPIFRKKTFLPRKIGLIGLGKMGMNMALRLKEKGWQVIGYDKKLKSSENIKVVDSINKLVDSLPKPKIIWLMVPAGKPVDETIAELYHLLNRGDIVIDGGNSFYKDSIRHYQKLNTKGIKFVDVGVSGGPEGARNGACLMIGGKKETFVFLEDLFKDLAVENGYQFFEGYGAGHFVKMIHNGIEYGMMQAIAEGFTILKNSKYKLELNKVAEVYNNGSVIESRLIAWLKEAFDIYGENLKDVSGKVAHTGEGEWTVNTAKEMDLKVKIIEGALEFRKQSSKNPSYTGKILTALRNRFGGHPIK